MISAAFRHALCRLLPGRHGRRVIKIDTCDTRFMDTTRILNGPYPDNEPGELYWEQGGTFQTLNRGKRSLTLDLRNEAAIEALKDLIRLSDVVMENFTPRVMHRFGLDYNSLKSVKPDLIMVSNTATGIPVPGATSGRWPQPWSRPTAPARSPGISLWGRGPIPPHPVQL